ncbi:MAG: GlmU family protein [Balneolaceae bacterium]|nr:GlmU family protein [Balneolaceae bacterium]
MQLCFFEDDMCKNFHPLTLTRPVDDLRIGIMTIAQKWEYALNASSIHRIVREDLKSEFPSHQLDASKPCYFINSRYVPEPTLLEKVRDLSPGNCLQNAENIIVACIDGETAKDWMTKGKPNFNSLFILESQEFLSIEQLWDLFKINGGQIKQDIELIQPSKGGGQISEHAILQNPEDIYIEGGATIEAGCILNAENGPIYIGENATVMNGALLRGPVAVCEGATIKMGAKIYEDTTIGPVCKVGGEVNNSIFHSYSNKGHDGFLGNSIIGQWCNLGADTNTSNLKNNYSTVRITEWDSETEIETGEQFFGTVMGDHTKTAINTQLNTGTICGVSCNIFSNDFPAKFIPSFSWVGPNVIQPYKLDKAFDAMQAMMARRDTELTKSIKKNNSRFVQT